MRLPVPASVEALVVACMLAATSACGGDDGGALLASGEACTDPGECASGYCEGGRCQRECSSNEDCGADQWCHAQASLPVSFCGAHCYGLAPDGIACVDGQYVRCSDLNTDAYCRSCGCDQGFYCDTEGDGVPSCQPQIPLGEPCMHSKARATENCSSAGFLLEDEQAIPLGQCVEAAGTPCTDQTLCDCEGPAGEPALCVQRCNASHECGANEVCIGNRSQHIGYCRRDCTGEAELYLAGMVNGQTFRESTCPDAWTSCTQHSDDSLLYPDGQWACLP